MRAVEGQLLAEHPRQRDIRTGVLADEQADLHVPAARPQTPYRRLAGGLAAKRVETRLRPAVGGSTYLLGDEPAVEP